MIINRTRLWAGISLVLFLGVLVFAIWQILRSFDSARPSAPTETETEIDIEDIEPLVFRNDVDSEEIASIEELEDFSNLKTIPVELEPEGRFAIDVPFDWAQEHVWGDTSARFTILQYSNFKNTFSSVMHPELYKLVEENSENVNWVFRHFPFDSAIHDWPAAIASECVSQQLGEEAFWQMTDRLFQDKFFTTADVIPIAEAVGANGPLIQQCMDEGAAKEIVMYDSLGGWYEAQLTVTPSFFVINNRTGEQRFIEGANAPSYLQRTLDEMILVDVANS